MIKIYILLVLVLTSNLYSQFVPEWVQMQSQTNLNVDNPDLSVMDTEGNIYIVNALGNSGNADIVLTKLSNTGMFLWQKIYNSAPPGNQDYPRKVLIDQSGNVIIAGNANDTNYSSNKIIFAKYSSTGILLSSSQYKRNGTDVTSISDFEIDINGNIAIAGLVHENQNYIDSALVAKFDNSFNLLWSKMTRDSVSYYTAAGKIDIDQGGNYYVTGISDYNLLAIKYDASGNLLWFKKYLCASAYFNVYKVPQTYMDSGQNLFIASSKLAVSGNDTSKTIVLKYNSSGILQWASEYNVSNTGTESPRRIFSLNSDIYIDVDYYDDSYLVKINSTGQLVWQRSMDHKVNYMAVDNENKILTTGFKNAYQRKDLCLEKFNLDGSTYSTYTYSYNGLGTDNATKFFKTSDNKILALGYHNSSVMLLKLTPSMAVYHTISRNFLSKPIIDSQYTYDTVFLPPADLPAYSQVKNVYINIDTILHTAVGDLVLTLVHEGKTDTLLYQRGGMLDNMIGTKFSDSSVSSICGSGAPPYTGYFRPCFPLSQFRNLSASGPWVLKIFDRRVPDIGLLKAWNLTVQYEIPIGLQPVSNEIPVNYHLSQNYPNPFNPVTKIRFSVPKQSLVKLSVYDILGKEINVLTNNFLQAGTYETDFNASALASGVYFYKLITKDYTETKKMVLIK
jgi:hypothetical protein